MCSSDLVVEEVGEHVISLKRGDRVIVHNKVFDGIWRNPAIAYNDLAPWRYSEMPHALGCDGWFTARVTTCGEFDEASQAAEQEGTAAYIEVVTDTYAAPPAAKINL